jgi:hypothetical protein
MRLEAWAKRFDGEEADLVVDAVEDNIEMVVKAIIDAGNGFVILSQADETYVQATTKGPVEDGFIVERRDGCAGEHYATDARRVSARRSELEPRDLVAPDDRRSRRAAVRLALDDAIVFVQHHPRRVVVALFLGNSGAAILHPTPVFVGL